MFSRYSRSTKSLRRTFFDEFLGDPELGLKDLLGAQTSASDDSAALKKARAFYDRVLVGYGDDSVAQLGGAHIACENISNVAANLLEDARIGIAPLEKSTRYVRFDQKDSGGNYLYYREPKIMASKHRQTYLEVMNLLFDTYSRQMEPMLEFVAESLPIDQLEVRDPTSGKPLSYEQAKSDEKLRRWAETAYRATVRAQACDVLRSYLPAATLTNVGMFGVGQAFEYLLSKLHSHELSEAKELAAAMHGELNQLIPSFVKRAQVNDYLSGILETAQRLARETLNDSPVNLSEPVVLVDYDRHAEEKIIAALLYAHARQPLQQLREIALRMDANERRKVLQEHFSKRRHRRDKPGRAFENVYYTFDILGNLGLYRDLHRHRILTQERQAFTTVHGYDTPAGNRGSRFQARVRCVHERGDGALRGNLPRPARRGAVRRSFRLQDPLVYEDEPARGRTPMRAAHHAPRPSGLPLHCPGDVAQDPGSSSDIGGGWKIYRLEKLSPWPAPVGDADGV